MNYYEMVNQTFQTSCSATPQFNQFYKDVTKHLKKTLKDVAEDFKFSKGHFYLSGFFSRKDGQYIYFCTHDVRFTKGFYIRTAKDLKDYTGGKNCNIKIDNDFEKNLVEAVKSL
jgi:hypothetical protein